MDDVRKYQVLCKFKEFCDALDDDSSLRRNFITIISRARSKEDGIRSYFKKRLDFEILDDEINFLSDLVNAYLSKRETRRQIDNSVRSELLARQNNKCAYCGAEIDMNSPVDHIIPFKYVGDELEDNYQILCTSCNSKKNKSLDYELRMRYITKSGGITK